MEEFVSYDIIATPLSKNMAGGGLVKILFYYDIDKNIREVDDVTFPSGTCYISKNYESVIENKYENGEIFKLIGISKTSYPPEDMRSSNYAEWSWYPSNKISSVNNELYRLINCPLPDKDTGELIIDDDSLSRGVYFILENDNVYGPFEITIETNDNGRRYFASVYNNPSIQVPTHHITSTKIGDVVRNDLLRKAELEGETVSFICSLKKFNSVMKGSWDVIDFISATQLMKFISSIEKKDRKKIMTNSVLTQVKQELENFFKNKNGIITSDRYSRAIELLSKGEENKDLWMDVLDDYITTDAGVKALQNHAVERYVSDIDEKVKSKKNELSKLQLAMISESNKLSDLNSKSELVKLDIKEQEEKLSRTQEEVENKIKKQNQELQTEKEKLEKDIIQIKSRIDTLKKEYSSYSTLVDVDEEIKSLDRDKSRINQAVEHLKSQLQSPKNMVEKITEVHAVMDILGYSQRQQSNTTPSFSQREELINIEPNLDNALDVIHTLCAKINEKEGRELKEIEVANIMICMQQNMMTFLQGKPGVGKTSTAINLASALNIYDPSNETTPVDFINIPVSRGWTSSRDFIGFYNGLKGNFQSSKTGLYDFLVNGEKIKSNASLRIVLLDEANLSPIEHYWSDFIGLTDKEGSSRSINIFGSNSDRNLFPAKYNSLRFLSTINNDSTTEAISQRLLNRSPVISMNEFKLSSEDGLGGNIIPNLGLIPLSFLEDVFGRNSKIYNEKPGGDLYEELEKVIITGLNLAPSLTETLKPEGRKLQSIISYLDVAGNLMFDNKTQAQDFALCQFILPHFKGDGEKVRLALLAMMEQAKNNNLEVSYNLLEKILKTGDSYLNSYSFF